MSSINRVILMGNLTRQPDLRTTPTGMSVCDLGIAMNDTYKNRDGQRVESVCFADVVTWGRQAETCAQYLHKGSRVMVEGRLQLDRWEKDGQPHSRLRVRADRVQFLGGRPAGSAPASDPDPADEAEAIPF